MISREEALAIARARPAERGWGMGETPSVEEVRSGWPRRLRKYEISSNPLARGTKARFTIDAETGAILAEGYIPR